MITSTNPIGDCCNSRGLHVDKERMKMGVKRAQNEKYIFLYLVVLNRAI